MIKNELTIPVPEEAAGVFMYPAVGIADATKTPEVETKPTVISLDEYRVHISNPDRRYSENLGESTIIFNGKIHSMKGGE